jgi:hypothetical protein
MPEMPEFSIQRTAGEPEGSVGAKGRTKPPKAISKPPQSHILGIYSGVQSHHRATPKPFGRQPKATPKPHQSHPKAPPKRHQSHPHATFKPPR